MYRHPEAEKNAGAVFDLKGVGLCTDLYSYVDDNGMTNEILEMDLDDVLPGFDMKYQSFRAKALELLKDK